MHIEDGTGTGYKARVSSENKLQVEAVTHISERHVNFVHGQAYSIVLDQVPTGTDDCILYVRNDDDDDLILSSISAFTSGSTELYLHLGDAGTPDTPTTLAPVNRDAGSGNVANCTCQQGADLATGAALSGGSEVDRFRLEANAQTYRQHWNSDIIVPKNQTFTLWSSAIVTVNATLSVFFHD